MYTYICMYVSLYQIGFVYLFFRSICDDANLLLRTRDNKLIRFIISGFIRRGSEARRAGGRRSLRGR